MADLTRFDPFASNLEDFFKGLFLRPVRLFDEPGQPQIIRLDIKEDDKAYKVKAEIPGVKKEDIHVSINGNQVSISAEVKKESEEKKGERVLRSERYYGQAYRSFTLDSEIENNDAMAKYADGILELTLPKKASTATRKLTIN